MTTLTKEMLLEVLPHGSGIDSDWHFEKRDDGSIQCLNYFHAMNSDGYYDGYMPFAFDVFIHDKDIIKRLKGPCEGQIQLLHYKGEIDMTDVECDENQRESFYGLKDYLEDTIYQFIHSLNFPKKYRKEPSQAEKKLVSYMMLGKMHQDKQKGGDVK